VFEPIDRLWFIAWAILLVLAIIWLGLVLWLFRRLRRFHSATYESIGSPTLFWNNSPRLNLLFARFLFSSQSSQLGDPALSTVCWVMRVLLCIYMVLFLAFVLVFVGTFMRRAFAGH
jgi:hypothetical protein